MQFADTLYPDWSGPRCKLPGWIERYGLSKCTPVIQRVYASSDKWQLAERDGIGNVAPVIVVFNREPKEIKQLIGAEAWKQVHHATQKANVDKLVLHFLGGWAFHEAMLFPAREKRRAKNLLHFGKSALLMACRMAAKGGSVEEWAMIARDFQRMGGEIDHGWGRKRLKREHDALAIQQAMRKASSEPWAKPWFHDVGEYSFSLLKSEAELVLEGACQRHCSGSYARSCRNGEEVVLRIEGPERATCSWRVKDKSIQVKAFANRDVSPKCRAAAKAARAAWEEMMKQSN